MYNKKLLSSYVQIHFLIIFGNSSSVKGALVWLSRKNLIVSDGYRLIVIDIMGNTIVV